MMWLELYIALGLLVTHIMVSAHHGNTGESFEAYARHHYPRTKKRVAFYVVAVCFFLLFWPVVILINLTNARDRPS